MKMRFNPLAPRAVVLTTVVTVTMLLTASACGPRNDEILEVEQERGPDGRTVLELDVHDADSGESYEVNVPANSSCGVGDVYSAKACGSVR